MRAWLLPNEAKKTDEELAALEVGGIDVVRFAGWFYRKIARVPGLEGKVDCARYRRLEDEVKDAAG